jgi:sugar-specific transcriptional regulator TrmB
METKLLEQIGLTKGEISVYFSLLELGSSTVGPIITKAKVSSSKIYDILDRLIQKGLVSYIIRENRKYFETASPKRILDYLKEKEESIKQQSEEIEKIMPQLLLKQKMAEKKQEVNIYEGVKGVKTAHEKILHSLEKGDNYFFMGASILSSEKFGSYFQDFHKRREKQGVSARILFNQNVPQLELEDRNKFKLCNTKYMPANISTPSWIVGFKDTTMIGVPSEDPIYLEIKNKDVAQSFKSYFEALWNQKVTVFEGPENVTKFFTNILSELKEGEEYHVLNGNQGIEDVPEIINFFRDYHIKRSKKGIKANFLFNHNLKNKVEDLALQPCEYKFLSPDFKSPLQMTFYKDKLYISLWAKKAIGFLIQRKDIVDAFKAYFDTMWNQDIVTYKGYKGIQAVWDDTLNYKELLFIGAGGYVADRMKNYFYGNYVNKAKKNGMKWKALMVHELKNHAITKLDFVEHKSLPPGMKTPNVIFLYGDKVTNVLWAENPIAFSVENKEISQSYRKYFDLLWNQHTQTVTGVDSIKGI